MMIHKHTSGSKVRLFQKYKEDKFWETEICEPVDKDPTGHCVCKPIIVNGSYVHLNLSSLIAEITDTETNRVYRYEIEKSGNINWNGTVYYALVSHKDSKPYNRRKEFRVEFVTMADIQIKANSKVRSCYVRDISQTGLGISIRKDSGCEFDIGDKVSISFTCNPGDRMYHVSGEIVRCVESDVDGEILIVGISLDEASSNPKWCSFVILRQRLQLQQRKLNME